MKVNLMNWGVIGSASVYIGCAVLLLGLITLIDRYVRPRVSLSNQSGESQSPHQPIDGMDFDMTVDLKQCGDLLSDGCSSSSEGISVSMESALKTIIHTLHAGFEALH